MKYYNCDRCGEMTARTETGLDTVYCGLCLIHLETGVIGYGLRSPRKGYKAPKWAHHLVR